jgi:drug/metabolite transporter (DMT)-like permease
MVGALLAAVLFAMSVIAAGRSARLIGAHSANFWRLALGTLLLASWAHAFGGGLGGGALAVFFVSGCIGFGLGDTALFQTIPRLGPRLSSLLINCLAAPFAASIEWLWLGTTLSSVQSVCGLVILSGVGLALAPEQGAPISRQTRIAGIVWGVVAGFGQGLGAVLSRKAFALAAAAGHHVDGGTAAYQRILGGLCFVCVPYLWLLLRDRLSDKPASLRHVEPAKRTAATLWVLGNALAGPTLGVACFQWALRTTPSGIVLPIVAMTPLVIVPFSYLIEGDRPGWRSLVGGVLGVAGVVGLTVLK